MLICKRVSKNVTAIIFQVRFRNQANACVPANSIYYSACKENFCRVRLHRIISLCMRLAGYRYSKASLNIDASIGDK